MIKKTDFEDESRKNNREGITLEKETSPNIYFRYPLFFITGLILFPIIVSMGYDIGLKEQARASAGGAWFPVTLYVALKYAVIGMLVTFFFSIISELRKELLPNFRNFILVVFGTLILTLLCIVIYALVAH